MNNKSHFEHIRSEKQKAEESLEKAKLVKVKTGTIVLDDNAHTTFIVKKERIKTRVKQLEAKGKKIKSIS